MSQSGLESFGAYQKARELFDFFVSDMAELRKDARCDRLVARQIASADSICANIEEGYGRLSRAEYVRFLDFSRSSARETRGCYERLHHWLNPDMIRQRISLADEVIGILTKTIATLQNALRESQGKASYLREDGPAYGITEESHPLYSRPDARPSSPSTLDPRPLPHD